jgi:hypothetical protein
MSNAARIKAAEGYVEVTVQNQKLESGLRQAETSCQKFQRKLDGFSLAMGAALTGAFIGVSRALKKVFGELIGYGDRLDKMSQRIAISVESLRQFDVIAQLCGTNLETLESTITKMNKTIGDAVQGSNKAEESFNKLGLSVYQLQEAKPDEAFLSILSSLSKIPNQAERTNQAMAIFGKQATQLFPLINSGSKGVEELQKQMKDLGITMSTADAQHLAELNDALTKSREAFKSLTDNLVIGLAPALSSFAEWMGKIIGTVTKFVKEHKTLVTTIGTAVGTYGACITAMVGWSIAAGKLSAALKIVNTSLKALSMNPWVLGITAAVGGIMLLINAFKKSKPEAEAFIEKAEKITATHQEQNRADNALMSELEELNNKTNKSAQEMARAEQICSRLNERYGDLGLSVNKATGEIKGLTDAQKKMNDAQREMKIADVKEEIRALEEQDKNEGEARRGHIADMKQSMETFNQRGYLWTGDPVEISNKLKQKEKEEADWQAKLNSRKDYLAALEAGTAPIDEGGDTGNSGLTDAQAKAYTEANNRKNKLADEAAKIGKKSWELKIEEAEEAYAKAIEDAETLKKGDIAYGLTEEEAGKNYDQNVADAQKIRDTAINAANQERLEEEKRIQEESERNQQEALERKKRLEESNQKESAKLYEDGLNDLEELRSKYSESMKYGRYDEAEKYGKEYEAKKEELELAKSNAELEEANRDLQEAIERLADAEANGSDEDKIAARNEYQNARGAVDSARDSQTIAQRAIFDRQKEQQEEADRQAKELADKQKEQQRKNKEYMDILTQDINANIQTSYRSRGSFSAWEVMGGGVSTEEKQLKEAERANRWNEKIYRELQEFNKKELSATYA